jgi:hypothetical protein
VAAFGNSSVTPQAPATLPDHSYLITPEVKPGLRRGGLISFFKKQ